MSIGLGPDIAANANGLISPEVWIRGEFAREAIGMLAATSLLPGASDYDLQVVQTGQSFARILSGNFHDWLLFVSRHVQEYGEACTKQSTAGDTLFLQSVRAAHGIANTTSFPDMMNIGDTVLLTTNRHVATAARRNPKVVRTVAPFSVQSGNCSAVTPILLQGPTHELEAILASARSPSWRQWAADRF